MEVNYHILANTIVLAFDGKIFKFDLDSTKAKNVIELIKADKLDEIPKLVDNELILKKYLKEKVHIVDGKVYSYGEPVHSIITTKILQFSELDLPFDNLINFWNNLKENPSKKSQDELYLFLLANEFPLTPDGHFIAYKRIDTNYKDLHTRTIDNSIGSVVTMPRDEVNDDSSVTCSHGLHVASYKYAKDFYASSSSILCEVKVNPRDVVSIPNDYSNAKCRCCEYKVIDKIKSEHSEPVVEGEKYEPDEVVVEVTEEILTPSCEVCGQPVEVCICDQNDTLDDIKIGNLVYNVNVLTSVTAFEQFVTKDFNKRKPSRTPKSLTKIDDYILLTLFSTPKSLGKVQLAAIYNDSDGNEVFITFV